MNNTSPANRNLLKYGLVLAALIYILYEFVMEYLGGTAEGFTLPVFAVGLLILGGGCVFAGVLTLRSWKESRAEAAAAIDAAETKEE